MWMRASAVRPRHVKSHGNGRRSRHGQHSHRHRRDVKQMAGAMKKAVEAGRAAYLAGMGAVRTKGASASSPLTGYLRD